MALASDTSIDPRVARSRAAVLAAARELLVEGGPQGFTVDAVSARSGVAKTTIYRHWPSQRELLVAVLRDCAPHVEPLPDADFETSLRSLVRGVAATMADPEWRRVAPAMLQLKLQLDDIGEFEAEMRAENLAVMATTVEKGIAAGRLRPDVDPVRMMWLLIGPMLMVMLSEDEFPDDLADEVVDRFLASEAALLGR